MLDSKTLQKYVNKGMSQNEIAMDVGVHNGTVSRWLRRYGLKTNRARLPRKEKQCFNEYCSETTKNPKFCSRSCSASWNNKHRKKKLTVCVVCGDVVSSRRKYCEACLPLARLKYGDDPTLSEILNLSGDVGGTRYSVVRARARKEYQGDGNICEECGYKKHVEVCHIVPISDFDLDTRLSVINHKRNIRILCPNCHWEFDNNRDSADESLQ